MSRFQHNPWYRGQREPKVDYFDDYQGDRTDSLAGTDAAEDAMGVQEFVHPGGLRISFPCGCTEKRHLDIPWSELVCLSHNISPAEASIDPDWIRLGPQLFQPNVGCGYCRKASSIMLTGGEAAQARMKGEQAGWVQNDPKYPHAVAYCQRLMAQAAQGQRRLRPCSTSSPSGARCAGFLPPSPCGLVGPRLIHARPLPLLAPGAAQQPRDAVARRGRPAP